MLKRADGRWQEQIKLPGMAKPKYFYGKTQKEVKQKMAEWRQEQTQGKRFEAAADAWEVWHTDRVEYNTAQSYVAAMKRTKEHFAGRYIHDIGPDEIDAYIRWLAGRGFSRRTVQVHLDMLNMIYDYAILNRWAESNPCHPVKVPPGLPKGKRELPTEDQIQRVRDGLDVEFGLFPFMLLHTGLRRGELLALRWEDIDRENKLIRVTKSVYFVGTAPKVKAPKTEAGHRTVVLLDVLADVLPENGEGYVFGGKEPLSKAEVERNWRHWCRAVGLARAEVKPYHNKHHGKEYDGLRWKPEITPHQLRHAFATILFDAGVDVKDAQDILGHASIQITRDIYTHIRQERRAATAEMLNRFLSGDQEKQESCQNVVKFPKAH